MASLTHKIRPHWDLSNVAKKIPCLEHINLKDSLSLMLNTRVSSRLMPSFQINNRPSFSINIQFEKG